MKLRVLKYFLTVVHEENITRAAEVLHIKQPVLSRQMSQLEEELGVQLFVRGKHFKLTDAGVGLCCRAEEVITLMKKIENEFGNQSEEGGIISIGNSGLADLTFLYSMMKRFREKYPKVQYELNTNSSRYIIEHLEQGLLDFAVLPEPIDITKFDYIRIKTKERFGLLVNMGHSLAEKEFIEKEDLLGMPLIMLSCESQQKKLERWMGEAFSCLNILAIYNMPTDIAFLLERGGAAVAIEGMITYLDTIIHDITDMRLELYG